MDKPLFQMVPLWLIFVATVGFILLEAARQASSNRYPTCRLVGTDSDR